MHEKSAHNGSHRHCLLGCRFVFLLGNQPRPRHFMRKNDFVSLSFMRNNALYPGFANPPKSCFTSSANLLQAVQGRNLPECFSAFDYIEHPSVNSCLEFCRILPELLS